jgi:hypothetical protein
VATAGIYYSLSESLYKKKTYLYGDFFSLHTQSPLLGQNRTPALRGTTYCSFAIHRTVILFKKKILHSKSWNLKKYDTSYSMTHGHSLVVGYFQKYGLHTIATIWWKLYIIIFQCDFINERIWHWGRKRGRAVLFKREQRVCDASWWRIPDHTFKLTVFVRSHHSLHQNFIKKLYKTVYMA